MATLDLATGYGDAGAEYARGLHRAGVPVCWLPLVQLGRRWGPRFGAGSPLAAGDGETPDPDYDPELLALLDRRVEYDIVVVHAPYEWWDRLEDRTGGARRVVYTTWEADRIPSFWAEALNRRDLVLVPSEFNRRGFVESGVRTRVEVVPHAARTVRPSPGAKFPNVSDGDFVFYTIGEWRARKNLEQTVRAYLETFTADDPVVLIVKTSDVDHDRRASRDDGRIRGAATVPVWWSLSEILSGHRHPARVHLIAGRGPRSLIDQLHTRGDCFVSLAHGEGWGLGAFEAALFGKPSIITGWGGPLDFLGADHPLLVRFDLVPVAGQAAGPTGDPMQRWAFPDRGHASELMRWAFENRVAAREIGEAVGTRVRSDYRADRVATAFARALGFELA